MIIANGESSPEWDEQDEQEHFAAMDHYIGDLGVSPGGEHEPCCDNVEWVCAYSLCHQAITENNKYDECISSLGHEPVYLAWKGDVDCDCETQEFSTHSCDTCGSSFGGSRHAVIFFKRTN